MIKRIISALLVCLMLAAMISCSGDNVQNGDNTTDTNTSAAVEQGSESETETADPYTFTGDFKVGYARIDITPSLPIPLNDGKILTRVIDPLYATCVAIKSGEETVLLYSLDIKNMSESFDHLVKSKIKLATGIKAENIMLNTMHNHSAPCTDSPSGNATVSKWRADLAIKLANLAKETVADLSDARPYIGTGKTTNIAFVRRFIYEDGSCRTSGPAPIVKHESEADDDVQVIRFVREDKKDVVMANWQCHVAHAIGVYSDGVSGDYVYHARKTVEEGDKDALFAFYLGAAANINLLVRIPELNRANGSYIIAGRQLGKEILSTLSTGMTPVNVDTAECEAKNFVAKNRATSEDEYKRASEFMALGLSANDANYSKMLEKYGFESEKEMNNAYRWYKRTGTSSLLIGAISIGDISFVCVPYEMFDTNGMEIKEASPDKMTFILSFTGGAYGYVPSALAVPNGSYEVYSTSLEFGTAEKVVAALLDMLNGFHK